MPNIVAKKFQLIKSYDLIGIRITIYQHFGIIIRAHGNQALLYPITKYMRADVLFKCILVYVVITHAVLLFISSYIL